MTDNYIDIGIDFGAENIIVVAIGKDRYDREDYRLINLSKDGNFGSVKNYLAEDKISKNIEIGKNSKLAYLFKNKNNKFNWVYGRYKANINEANQSIFKEKSPNELLEQGLKLIIEKINDYNFSTILSGKLRNLCVGIPQLWDISKKEIYHNILNKYWKNGETKLLTEPLGAIIASDKSKENEIIMIIDIGASTTDISFAKYINDKEIKVFPINSRNFFAGHYFDILFSAFTLSDSINQTSNHKKLSSIKEYIKHIKDNELENANLLLNIETIKESKLLNIVDYGSNEYIDNNENKPLKINRKIYLKTLSFYTNILLKNILSALEKIKLGNNQEIEKIDLFLCGGSSSLYKLDKEITKILNTRLKNLSFSKSNNSETIDSTIAVGLAKYAQDNSIILKQVDFSIKANLPFGVNGDEIKSYTIFLKGDKFPFKKNIKLSKLIGTENELQYYCQDGDGFIDLNLTKTNKDDEKLNFKFKINKFNQNDIFDIHFNLDFEGDFIVKIINLSQKFTQTKIISFN